MPPVNTVPSQFLSEVFRLFDGTDVSKKTKFILTGITSGNIRELSVPNQNGTIALEGHSHVESDISDLEHVDSFTDLIDTPISIDSDDIGKVVKVADNLSLEFAELADGGGVDSFTELTDTPNEYASADIGKILRVKDDLIGVEFTDSPVLVTATFSEPVVGVFPVLPEHFTTKEYTDLALGARQEFFFSDTPDATDSYLVDYNVAYPHETGEAQSQIVTDPALGEGSHLIKSFITEIGLPNTTLLRAGILQVHTHAKKGAANQRITKLQGKLISRTHPGGVETVRVVTELSEELTTSELMLHLYGALAEDVVLNATDRLVLELWAVVTTGAQDAVVIVFMEGNEDCFFSFETSSGIWQTHGNVLDNLNTLGVAADNEFIVGTGEGAFAYESGATARTSLGLIIGTNVQAWDASLDSIAALTYVSDSFIKVTEEDSYDIRTIAETKTDLSLNLVENTAHSTDAHTMTIDGRDVSVDGTKLDGIEALADVTSTNETSHSDVLVDGDFGSAGLMNTDGAGAYSIKAIGTDVQAYHANLAAIVAGTWTGANSITTLGTIATGVWEGTSIAVGYTDAKCIDALADQTSVNETSHTTVVVDGDFASNGILNRIGAGVYSILALGTDVQAFHANLAAIVAGTWTGANSITTLGTIATVGNITIANGGTIGQAAGPLLTFDDTNDFLKIAGCKVSIGGTHTPGQVLDVRSTSSSFGDGRYNMFFFDNTAMAAGVGAGMVFGGCYTAAGAQTSFAVIWGEKENADEADFAGQMHLGTRVAAGSVSSDLIINSLGNVGIGIVPVTKFTVEGALTLKEQAAADGDTEAYGQIWVKTATPNTLWFTDDAGGDFQLSGIATGVLNYSFVYDPPEIANGAEASTGVTVTGAAFGDFVLVSFSANVFDLVLTGEVTSANIVTVVFANNTGVARDLASGTVYIRVLKK